MLRQKLERAGTRGVLCADTSGSFWACRRTGAGEVVVAVIFISWLMKICLLF